MYVTPTMDASADKSDWCAPRLADLRRQRGRPCWLYKHEFYLWTVAVDRETECEGMLSMETTVDAKGLEGVSDLHVVQDQLDEFKFCNSASQTR